MERLFLYKDITALREMELHQERNKRLIAMGEMAAQSFLQLCSKRRYIRSLNHILTNMLLFARPGKTNLRPVMSSEIIRGVLQMLGPILNSKNVEIHCPEEDHLVMADRELLIQAILNIVINAIEAMPIGGDLFINIYEEDGFINSL